MTEKEAERLAAKKFPLGEKEKKCIDAFGRMIINRAKYKRELLLSDMAKESNPAESGTLCADCDNQS